MLVKKSKKQWKIYNKPVGGANLRFIESWLKLKNIRNTIENPRV